MFRWPAPADIVYRLWRLKRLIAVGTALPLIVFALWSALGLYGGSFWLTAGLLLLIVAAHAVMFPNASQETTTVAIALTAFALLKPLIGWSFFGWVFFLIFAVCIVLFGQGRVLAWQAHSRSHKPSFLARVKTSASVDEARNWFPMQPGLDRFPYRCGEPDDSGRFAVYYQPTVADPLGLLSEDVTEEIDITECDPSFYAETVERTDTSQHTEIFDRVGAANPQSVVVHQFTPKGSGCVVAETDAPDSYPIGQSAFLWLTDFQTDGLVLARDQLEQKESRALRQAHSACLLSLTGAWFMRRMMPDGAMTAGHADQSPLDDDRLAALLSRLGPDFQTKGYTAGPMPLVTIEEFFDGNSDHGSFQGAALPNAEAALGAIRARADVADVRLGITQWEGPSTWPLAEYIHVVTTASTDAVKGWLADAGVHVSETGSGDGHRESEVVDAPDGYHTVWAWID